MASGAALFEDVPALSSEARSLLVAYYDGRVGILTDGSHRVLSWTPVDGNGMPLASMVVTQSGSGLDFITSDGSGKLAFSSTDGSTSRQLQGRLVVTAGTAYTILWKGSHSTPAPFQGQGNYVYNIGNELNHQRQVASGVPAVELYDGSTTHRGTVNVNVIDNATTVWSTIYNGRTHQAYADGFNLGIPGTPNYNVPANPVIFIGAFNPDGFNFNGRLSDLIIFKGALGETDRLLLEQHLTKPELAITRLESAARLVWPASAGQFVLEAATSVEAPDWKPVPITPILTRGKWAVTNSTSEARMIFRLVP
ncbi:MAG: hypothetical protein JNN07_21360 [Verrucomicrobiales bacterium]|nr:hypothetical protein [Verrucomicrobiales bacterium]